MTPFDPAELQAWYREAMKERIRELEALRSPLAQRRKAAGQEARAIGHSLLGSGGTFGFPEVSVAGKLVEEAEPRDLLRRVEGLISVLGVVAHPDANPVAQRFGWLARVAKVDPAVLDRAGSADDAWRAVAEAARTTEEGLAADVARRFKLKVADFTPQAAALRLVPEALMREALVLPLREDGTEIVMATADPLNPEVESRLAEITGRGVVFEVAPPTALREALSALEAPVHERPKDATDEPRSGRPVVLVVDDSATSRIMARKVLEAKDYQVHEAEDGVDGLEAFSSTSPRPDVVVVDLEMPRMDGRAFVRNLRSRPEGASVPVIVFTSAQDPQLEADLIEDGADDYIRKPLDPRLFLARVAATLRRARA